MSKTKLYIFSGLGADERVFQLMDLSAFDVTFIKWITPLKNECIQAYAARLLPQITSRKPVLVGLSFGGMMAMEIAKHIKTERIVVLASAKTKDEIPLYYRIAGRLRLHRLLPLALFKKATVLSNWFFGVKSNYEQQILKQIIHDTEPVFMEWAIGQIVHWDNSIVPDHTFHIHGTADRILPLTNVKADMIIPGGGHFMTLNKSKELSEQLGVLLG